MYNDTIKLEKDDGSYANWKTTNETPKQRGENVIVDCLLLSKCDYLIKNNSNISNVSIILNPHIPSTYIHDKDTIYNSS